MFKQSKVNIIKLLFPVRVLIEFLIVKTAKSLNKKPDCPGWLCNITNEFGLLLNNNSVACYPGTKDTLS